MRKVRYGTLKSYRDGVAAGTFDTDLIPEDRAAVVRCLDYGLSHVQWCDGIPAGDLYGRVRDPYTASGNANARVRDILEGCAA